VKYARKDNETFNSLLHVYQTTSTQDNSKINYNYVTEANTKL